MAWGGGFGGGMFGQSASAASARAGLPFGGFPSELREEAERLLASEPAHAPADLTFTQRPSERERRRLTLPGLVFTYPRWVTGASLTIILNSLVLQAGPLLTEVAIARGMEPGHHHLSVVALCALAYLVLALAAALLQRAGVNLTGRLSSRVMHDLRIKVFTHLQRLSLDFFTEVITGRTRRHQGRLGSGAIRARGPG